MRKGDVLGFALSFEVSDEKDLPAKAAFGFFASYKVYHHNMRYMNGHIYIMMYNQIIYKKGG